MSGEKEIKKILVFVVGMTILLFGLALLVLPGPGIPIIILALILLATEFLWAQRLLNRVKSVGKGIKKGIKKKYNYLTDF